MNKSVQAEIALAQSAYQTGNHDRAEALIDQLLLTHPSDPDVLVAKGMMYFTRGDLTSAHEMYAAGLDARPDDSETLFWVALTRVNLRRFSEAEEAARRLTLVAPKDARGFFLLGTALRGLDRFTEALAAIDRSLVLNPTDPDSLTAKGRLLRDWHMPTSAVEYFRKSMAVRPSLGAAVELAQIALRDSRPAEAMEVLKRIEALVPADVRPHAFIAEAYTMLHRFDEAEKKWLLAKKYSSNPGATLRGRALAEIAMGRFDVAEKILFDLLDKGDDPIATFPILTTGRKMKAEDVPLIEKMVGLASSGAVSSTQKRDLSYALGKSFDDLKDYERAMAYYDEANRLACELYGPHRAFDRKASRAFTDFLISLSSPERIRETVALGLESSLPVFVVGMMRSGTTLTESVLSAHSKVKGAGEQAFWTERVVEFIRPNAEGLRYDHESVLRFANDYLQMMNPGGAGTRYVVDKNPANIDLAGILHGAFPNAKFVHIKRNAVDNLLSLWMTPLGLNVRYASDRSNLVFAYREYLRLWQHWQEVLPPDRFETFRYEDLTAQPRPTITSMLEYLDLKVEPACFSPEKNERSVLTPSVYQVRQPINIQSQKRWKNYEPWLGDFAELLDEAEA